MCNPKLANHGWAQLGYIGAGNSLLKEWVLALLGGVVIAI